MTTTDLAIIVLAVTCALFMPAILFIALRNRRHLLAAVQDRQPLQDAEIAAILARVQTVHSDRADTTMETITEQVTEIRKGFDWLVSDFMIQQAIDMAQAGLPAPKITAQTGISSAEIAAITTCRNH
jgi:uncharacterized protein YerC